MQPPAKPTVRDLLLARSDDAVGRVHHGDASWTWAEHVAESARRAHWLLRTGQPEEPRHVGLLAGNSAEFCFWLGGCALAGAVAVGLNPTRTTAELVRDARHTDCLVVLVDDEDSPHASGLRAAGVRVLVMDESALRAELAACSTSVPIADVASDALWMLIFTSGTTSDPKAVRCSQGRLAHSGSMVGLMAGLGPDDVVLTAMPLFHSNAVIAGWIAALSAGADLVVRDFSARGFVADLRRHRVTYANYVGKALSYVVQADVDPHDAELPLRVVFGNEASESTIADFASRFDCRVIDAYGSTEGGISLLRTEATPRGALGVGIGDVRVLDGEGRECPRAVLDEAGQPSNAEEAIGELVNLDGPGGFEGYWRNPEADAERLQSGHFHSGDLAWRDEDGFFWFAGRTGEWVRVDGENLAVAPIERALQEHPDVREAVVVAVADPDGGDQVLAWLEVQRPESFDAEAFAGWCRNSPSFAAKAVPRWLRLERSLPRTATNKVLRAHLRARGLDGPGVVLARAPRTDTFTALDAESRTALAPGD